MNLPVDVVKIVGYYAVSSLFDLMVLVRAGLLAPHCQALSYAPMEYGDVDRAMRAIGAPMLGHVRKLKLCETSSDALLQRLANLAPRLQELDLGQCQGLSHTQTIGRFHALRKLTMTRCTNFNGFQTDTLRELDLTQCATVAGRLGPLTRLSLTCCILGPSFALSETLQHLTLCANRVGADANWCEGMELSHLTELQSLTISCVNSFGNSQARVIERMQHLDTLSIKGCPRLTDYSFLPGLDRLRTLHVEGPFDWSMLRHLHLHVFSANQFRLRDLEHLSTQRRLRSLRLDQTCMALGFNVGDPAEALSTLIADWPDLHTLDLFHCIRLLATHTFPVCPSVKCLKIDFCKLVDDDRLRRLLHSFPNVEVLSANFTRVTDAGLASVPHGVRELRLRGCRLTDAALPFLRPMRFLTMLDIAYSAVQHVAELPKSVRVIDVAGCADSCIDSTRQLVRGRRVKIKNMFAQP